MEPTSSTAAGFFVRFKFPIALVTIVAIGGVADYVFRTSDLNVYEKGLTYMTNKDFDTAIKYFQRSLRQNPQDAGSHFALGWAYHSKNMITEAEQEYKVANGIAESTLVSGTFNMGVILQAQRRFTEAEAHYRRVLLIKPDAANAKLNLSFVYLEIGQEQENAGRISDAKQYYQAAIDLNPQSPAKERLAALR